MENQPPQNQEVQIKAQDEILAGRYSNILQLHGSKEEFCMDFLHVFPPMGSLVARIVVSPEHLKRIARVLSETIARYEKENGAVSESEEPSVPPMGFRIQ